MKARIVRKQRRRGFTLLEMLIVLAIILVVAAMVVPNLLGRQKTANIKTTKASIAGLENALKQYAVENGAEFPVGGQEVLEQLVTPIEDPTTGRVSEPMLDKIPLDAWGQPLYYQYDGSTLRPQIWSSGPNKIDEGGGGDDVSNFEDQQQL